MRYYVIDAQGAQYGPADINLLNQWAGQGRVVPSTMLVEEATGRQILASSLPGLRLMGPGMSAGAPFSPPGSPFGPATFGLPRADGSSEATISYWLSGASFFLCACLPLVGILPAVAALFYAGAAMRKGARNGGSALLLAILAIGVQALMTILQASFLRMIGGVG